MKAILLQLSATELAELLQQNNACSQAIRWSTGKSLSMAWRSCNRAEMGVRLLEDRETGQAVMYCSTTDWAFGPLMPDKFVAKRFIESLEADPRLFLDGALEARYADFRTANVCSECGHLRETDCPECAEGLPCEKRESEILYHIDGDYSCMCINEPEPAPGEQYICRPCARRRELKSEKREAICGNQD